MAPTVVSGRKQVLLYKAIAIAIVPQMTGSPKGLSKQRLID